MGRWGMLVRVKLRGIDGLEGREPVGAVLSVGIKAPGGNPIEKDRFHLLDPMPDANNRRHHHPRFKPFNDAPAADRRVIVGQLVHQSEEQCFGYKLLAYRAKGHPSHPRRLPFCEGDGIRARRYVGIINDEHTFEDIVCPNDRCEFRVRPKTSRGLGPATCKPWSKLLFRIRWGDRSNLPSMLVKYTTRAWSTTKAMIGLFDQIRDQATMVLGDGRAYTLGGFEFTMTLGEGTNPEQHTRFPVVTFAPLTDPISHFMAQVDRFERIGQVMGPLLEHQKPPMALEHEAPEQDGQDFLDHVPGVE